MCIDHTHSSEGTMAIEIKFTCNICRETYVRADGKNKIPLGWGAIRPTLRVNVPPWEDKMSKKKTKQRRELQDARDELKAKLCEHEYHLCHICLQTNQGKILRISDKKVAE